MTQRRNASAGSSALRDEPTLSARSVLASTLLGTEPPWLPTRLLVRAGELFGIAEGTTRVAISRMQRAGELEAHEDGYRLVGRLLDRQDRQAEGRLSPGGTWDGTWVHAIVVDESRPAAERSALRSAMTTLRLAEERPGVWTRPDNLAADRHPDAMATATAQCRWWRGGRPAAAGPGRVDDADPDAVLAAGLWDLAGWSARARDLLDVVTPLHHALDAGESAALRPGFVASAAVLRHLLADPLLPTRLLSDDWPGSDLRERYDAFDRAFRTCLRGWFHEQS